MNTISQKLRTWTVDWNGAPMVDGEPPRDGIHCVDLRDAADEIDRLRAEVADLTKANGLLHGIVSAYIPPEQPAYRKDES